MLNKEEEHRLSQIMYILNDQIKMDQMYSDLKITLIGWLALKLKETNDECSKVHLELQQANEALARLNEDYY